MTSKSKEYEFENEEWLASLDFIIDNESSKRVREIIGLLHQRARNRGISLPATVKTADLGHLEIRYAHHSRPDTGIL